MDAQEVIRSWARFIPIDDQRALLGVPEPKPPPLPPPILVDQGVVGSLAGETPERAGRMPAPLSPGRAGETPAPLPLPRRPSIWENNLQPLFVENWYIVAGVLIGVFWSSLLACYSWGKHWRIPS